MKIAKYLGIYFIIGCTQLQAGTDVERMSIIGSRENLQQQAGSAYRLEDDELNQFSYSDIHRILKQVPGVNIQEEDGLGLRPNIGLRGGHPHRSRKVTILEDSVLVGPAPYSAPAAYYFPMVSRAYGVEVFKGPSAIPYGPNSIGGAINIMTRPIPDDFNYGITTELGSYGSRRANFVLGNGGGNAAYLLEGGIITGDGFKTLPFPYDLGFWKSDVMAKFKYRLSPRHSLALKTVVAQESSQETYLGLSSVDFDKDPYQRYPASARDRMQWHRHQVMLSYDYDDDNMGARLSLYRHWFDRNWSKFKGFTDENISPRDVLNNPVGVNQSFYRILKGEEDSLSFNDGLVIGDNKRTYLVEGVQGDFDWSFPGIADGTRLLFGLRHHKDKIFRNHTDHSFLMIDGMVKQDESVPSVVSNQTQDSSAATSAFLQGEQYFGNLKLSVGNRHEWVATNSFNPQVSSGGSIKNSDHINILGFGAFYQWTPTVSLLAGVNQGVSLVGPGQLDEIKPEEAVNSEAGVRYQTKGRSWSLVSFYSDYRNIKGTCSFSSGCQGEFIDREYNGGEALIRGVEFLAMEYLQLSHIGLNLNLTYTYTDAHFISARASENAEWGIGIVHHGDPLPYISRHMLHLKVGLIVRGWEMYWGMQHKSAMYDQAVAEGRLTIPSFTLLDLSLIYHIDRFQKMSLRVDNALDKVYLTSVRPFGQRPGKPRSFMFSYQLHTF